METVNEKKRKRDSEPEENHAAKKKKKTLEGGSEVTSTEQSKSTKTRFILFVGESLLTSFIYNIITLF